MRGGPLTKDNGLDFSRVVRLGSMKDDCRKWNRRIDIFCKIEFTAGKLSISGVEGPLQSGNALGSCGQIDMHLREQQKQIGCAPGWNKEKLAKFFTIWKEWHLNDLCAACEHQRALGWLELACEEVTLYHFRLTTAATNEQKRLKSQVLDAAAKGESYIPTEAERVLMALPYEAVSEVETLLHNAEHYEPRKPLYKHDHHGATEKKTLGWLNVKEHSRGLLCRPCPECGYKYGTAWQKREVPQEVTEFLRALPVSDKTPAWV